MVDHHCGPYDRGELLTHESELEPSARRILVVDDDVQVLSSLCAVLRAAKYQVVAAESGEAALALAREFVFDLALSDRWMPGMDGIELLEALRELQPMCSRVLLTGGLDLNTAISAVNRGAITCVLEKPVRSEALRNVVAEAFESRRQMVRAYRDLQRQNHGLERQMVAECIECDHLGLALQPIVHARSGDIFGYEALLRSSHPHLVTPEQIIAATERHRRLPDLAAVVVARAAECFERVKGNRVLFINLHPCELADPSSLEERLEPLRPFADRVILEITERSSLYGVTAWERSVQMLGAMGFDIAVDDIGAGYSALAVLAELKPRYIKIDMSIVRDVDHRPHRRRLVDLLCRFAEATHAKVIAEGIETEGEAAAVRACGSHLLQGYLFGRPQLPAHLRLVGKADAAAPPAEPEQQKPA